MRAYPVIVLFMILIPQLSKSQVAIQWQRSIGGSDNDVVVAMEQTSDGGYICGGFSDSGISGDKSESNRGENDYWLVKINSSGIIQWQKTIGGNEDDYLHTVIQTSDGGYICGGRSVSSISGDKTENSRGLADYWVVKLDSAGNIQWQKTIGGSGNDFFRSLIQTADGGYLCGGFSHSNISGEKSENSKGGYDYWIIKLNSAGAIQWQKTIGGTNDDELIDLRKTIDGGYICGGHSRSDISGDKTEDSRGGYDYWVVKLDPAGSIQWQKTIGGNDWDLFSAISHTADGSFNLAGYSSSGISGDKSEASRGDVDFWLVKLDLFGILQSQKTLGGSSYDGLNSIASTSDGGFICGGESASNISGDKSEDNWGSYDTWIFKLDQYFNIIWQNTLGGTASDVLKSVSQTSDGGYISAVSSASSVSGDKTEASKGNYDYWIVKFTDSLSIVTGKTFADLNSNNQQDSGEPSLRNIAITEPISGAVGFSGINGPYYIPVLDTGMVQVSPVFSLNHYSHLPSTHSAYFSAPNQTDSLNDFAYQPISLINDLCVTITPATPFRSGFSAGYIISYENVGTTMISNSSVMFYPDTNILFGFSSPTPDSVYPDSVIWSIGTLTPFQSGSILVTVDLNTGLPIGTIISSGATIYPVAGDANPACNTNYWDIATIGSYDPNDILVDRDKLYDFELLSPPDLEYIIRFQNTGNDTAFYVRILNPIDTAKLELSTFQFVSSSHPADVQFIYHERNMEFMFENILLPDSITNEPMSHGFVRYRIKTKNTLAIGDTVKNKAHIYFDFNDPIATDTAITEVVMSTGSNSSHQESISMMIYPNPASGDFTVSFVLQQDAVVAWEVFNSLGQKVKSEVEKYAAGMNNISLPVFGLMEGVYIFRLTTNGITTMNRLVKLKK